MQKHKVHIICYKLHVTQELQLCDNNQCVVQDDLELRDDNGNVLKPNEGLNMEELHIQFTPKFELSIIRIINKNNDIFWVLHGIDIVN